MPVQTLLDYLEDGDSTDVFLDHFPSVKREQTIGVLRGRSSSTFQNTRY